jgi:hypothetical protein
MDAKRARTPQELWDEGLYCPSCFREIVEEESDEGVMELCCKGCNISTTEKQLRKLLPPDEGL